MYVAVAGKGSTGKSTIAALAVDWLVAHTPTRPLVIDADPHQSLCTLLGLQPPATLGSLRSQYERALITGRDPALQPDESRTAFAERLLARQALCHADAIDLLALGQWDLPGSQCTPNRVMGYALAQLLPAYATTLIDHEAGVEHIGRFSAVPIDHLIVVATPEALSLAVAGRIVAHAQTVGRTVRSAALLLNRVQPDDLADPTVCATLDQLAAAGLPLLAALPESADVRASSRAGHTPLTLPLDDPWRHALAAIMPQVFMLPS